MNKKSSIFVGVKELWHATEEQGGYLTMAESSDQWWGDYTFDPGASAQWEIGPLQIAVQRLPSEWLVAHEQIETTEGEQEWRFAYIDLNSNESESTHVLRFVYQSTAEVLTVLPALADRSVVSRPYRPFTVPVNESATIYLSTPLWFRLATGMPSQTLFEIPIQRPSDTWFGPSTQEGETCYASRTHGRLNLENLSASPNWAITQVHINNDSAVPLLIERLNIPVPYLSLFHTQGSILWTEAVTVVQTRSEYLAEFNIGKEPPQSATGAKLITTPRQDPQQGMLIRAFSALKLQGSD